MRIDILFQIIAYVPDCVANMIHYRKNVDDVKQETFSSLLKIQWINLGTYIIK